MKKLVIALGGNALGDSPEEQLQLVQEAAKSIVDLTEEGYQVVVGHGNGPQVGMINSAMEFAATNGANTPLMPFPECGSMSQGYIGYHLQQSIGNELKKRGIVKDVVALVTEVAVKAEDPAFDQPTKPIGAFYTKEEAAEIAKARDLTFVEDSGRGYRRVIASPEPQEIVQLNVIKNLVDSGTIVITVGGGGIPVTVEKDGSLRGVAAVIDKDKSTAKLAETIEADMLVILTGVDRVCINFNQPNQKELDTLTLEEIEQYIEEKHFAPGSMLPKIEACVNFLKATPNGKALVTSLERAKDALKGETGTLISN